MDVKGFIALGSGQARDKHPSFYGLFVSDDEMKGLKPGVNVINLFSFIADNED